MAWRFGLGVIEPGGLGQIVRLHMREIKFNSIGLFQIGIKDCQKGRYVAGAECCIELLDKLKKG